MLAQGSSVAQVLQHLEVTEATYYRWRNQFGAMSPDEAKRLKELEAENARLKKLLAEAELDKAMLKEIAEDAPIDVKCCEGLSSPFAGLGRLRVPGSV